MFFIPTLPFLDSSIDFATISFIAALLLLSLFSIYFIFHLRFKSKSSHHLQNFNSLWTVRFLFVFFITFWALTELLRLPLFRRRYVYPLVPQLTVPQQANLCKVHLVLSLGFFEPGFLVTLLFLLDVSVKKTSPRSLFSVFFVLASCLPIFILQVDFLFFQGPEIRFPEPFHRSWFVSHENTTVLCAYPLLSTILFGVFGAIFSLSFLLSFWRVVSHVINKALRVRIFALAFTVIITLALQILLMGLSVFWTPDKTAFDGVALLVFLSTFTCAVVVEGILVIKPIADSLAAGAGGGESCQGSRHGERSPGLRPVENGDSV
ncbi:hypothetical protein QUC31_008368 [Theobroma cacao]|nr:PREDICTED: uncharacterized protein LOC108660449 [Theobroma cacao]WRX19547.1 hypothetical protein QQP08_012034 [Theobroma cacao]